MSFAFTGLFVVGNNLRANDAKDIGEIPPAITCHQDALSSRCNVCWIKPTPTSCFFTGYQRDRCCI